LRILSRKIWRAFPELDQFDDRVCKMYIKQARALHNSWRGAILVVASVFVAGITWIIVSFFLAQLLNYLQVGDRFETTGVLFIFTGFIWFPGLVALHIRDRWLLACIKKQIRTAACGACGYSLLGLEIGTHKNEQAVKCPECCEQTILAQWGLTKADIDPTLLAKESS